MVKNTQTNDILMYMKTHKKGITQKQAFDLFGAMRLSSIIYNLRKHGHKIKSTVMPVKNRYGGTSMVSTYVLED